MQTYLFEAEVLALTSISHIGDTHGVNAKLRREKIAQPDGTVEEVPVISGNSIRGILRDRGMLQMLRLLGYGIDEATGAIRGLPLDSFYFLFSGGALTSTGARGLDIDEARRWRDLIPLVAIFGGAMGNQIMPGKVKVGKMLPICQETAHILPERYAAQANASIWDCLQEEAYTRRDDEKSESLRQLLAPEQRLLLEAAAKDKREKRGTDDDVAGEKSTAQQMRYFVETIAAGTRLFWDVALDDVTPLEFEAFCATLAEFARWPYLGGKSGVGHGKVQIRFQDWLAIDPRLDLAGTKLQAPLGNAYLEHLRGHGDEIRGLLDGH